MALFCFVFMSNTSECRLSWRNTTLVQSVKYIPPPFPNSISGSIILPVANYCIWSTKNKSIISIFEALEDCSKLFLAFIMQTNFYLIQLFLVEEKVFKNLACFKRTLSVQCANWRTSGNMSHSSPTKWKSVYWPALIYNTQVRSCAWILHVVSLSSGWSKISRQKRITKIVQHMRKSSEKINKESSSANVTWRAKYFRYTLKLPTKLCKLWVLVDPHTVRLIYGLECSDRTSFSLV